MSFKLTVGRTIAGRVWCNEIRIYMRNREEHVGEDIFWCSWSNKKSGFQHFFFEEIKNSLALAFDYIISMGMLITSVGGG